LCLSREKKTFTGVLPGLPENVFGFFCEFGGAHLLSPLSIFLLSSRYE
jgi:hypothetical protein